MRCTIAEKILKTKKDTKLKFVFGGEARVKVRTKKEERHSAKVGVVCTVKGSVVGTFHCAVWAVHKLCARLSLCAHFSLHCLHCLCSVCEREDKFEFSNYALLRSNFWRFYVIL